MRAPNVVLSRASYFLLAFLDFASFFFGVNGLGGVFSMRHSTSSSLGLGFVSIGTEYSPCHWVSLNLGVRATTMPSTNVAS